MKTIHIEALDKQSVDEAIAELRTFNNSLKDKCRRAEEEVAKVLAELISNNLLAIPYTDDIKDTKTHTPEPTTSVMGAQAIGSMVKIGGTDIVFVEFGAGIYHNANGQQNPLAESVTFDTGIGSYGQGHGNQKYWFIAHNKISCGTPAYMPIYLAIQDIKPMIPTIVRGIFV